MEEEDLKYLRCPNCGEYFASYQENENRFCSEECKIFYRSCTACGKYFVSTRDMSSIFCSNECGVNPELEAPQKEQILSLLQQPQTLSADNL